ncbi:restriction endonuclease [Azospirillum sp. YIM B02556]|uniref:Restriction endonuclease n=1 Tax=Azospirillum endophyticum TaxID=2800326 RepID=A0ABS1F3N2_9PROT|nr:restriction endonuclease [Azospirillum endophyticum]MBK1838003.1 restriction endonuclease [Azospirillum endophyticum]
MVAKPIRTIGPLHLEDLEPHRFEDLVRQLLYDFRPWRQLEATGRGGGDEGFDARGWEIVPDAAEIDQPEEDGETSEPSYQDRQWLVQCKREKAIGPGKLVGYLDEVPEDERGNLYGIVFAAACDFSMRARTAFREKVRELGISEAHLWGKAELEDMLFQPKNDHLLFAYTGISLQVRRRSVKTEVRARLAMKRKATRHLREGGEVLIRDAEDDRFPYLDETPDNNNSRGNWMVRHFQGCFHDGLRFQHRRHFAFLDDDGVHWDFAESMDDAAVEGWRNPWAETEDDDARRNARHEAFHAWEALPEKNRAWFEVHTVLPYENIIDIDELGDDAFHGPQIFTTQFYLNSSGPFLRKSFISLHTLEGRWHSQMDSLGHENRVEVFSRDPRKKQFKA